MKKPALAIVLLAVGLFMLLEGSKLSNPSLFFDLALVVVGVVLTISYLPLMGDYLEKRFNSKQSITYMPMLAILGAALLWQAASRSLNTLDMAIFGVVGVALLLGSVFYLYRAIKSS